MTRRLDETELAGLAHAMEAVLAVARTYRQSVADEDSIVLMHELLRIDAVLGTGAARPGDEALLDLPRRDG